MRMAVILLGEFSEQASLHCQDSAAEYLLEILLGGL